MDDARRSMIRELRLLRGGRGISRKVDRCHALLSELATTAPELLQRITQTLEAMPRNRETLALVNAYAYEVTNRDPGTLTERRRNFGALHGYRDPETVETWENRAIEALLDSLLSGQKPEDPLNDHAIMVLWQFDNQRRLDGYFEYAGWKDKAGVYRRRDVVQRQFSLETEKRYVGLTLIYQPKALAVNAKGVLLNAVCPIGTGIVSGYGARAQDVSVLLTAAERTSAQVELQPPHQGDDLGEVRWISTTFSTPSPSEYFALVLMMSQPATP